MSINLPSLVLEGAGLRFRSSPLVEFQIFVSDQSNALKLSIYVSEINSFYNSFLTWRSQEANVGEKVIRKTLIWSPKLAEPPMP